jgi:hypothetical protein
LYPRNDQIYGSSTSLLGELAKKADLEFDVVGKIAKVITSCLLGLGVLSMFRVGVAVIHILALTCPNPCEAEYAYLSGNPYVAQNKLLTDVLEDKVASDDFTAEGFATLKDGGPFGVDPAVLRSLGEIREICMTFALKDTRSEMLAFRIIHQNGCGDWGVRIQLESNKIDNASMVKLQFLDNDHKNCGPPGILPAVTDKTRFFTLPARLSCREPNALDRVLTDTELKQMCEVAEGICHARN